MSLISATVKSLIQAEPKSDNAIKCLATIDSVTYDEAIEQSAVGIDTSDLDSENPDDDTVANRVVANAIEHIVAYFA